MLEIHQKESLERKREGGKEAGRGRPKQVSRSNGTPTDPPASKGFGRASDVAGAAVGVSGDSVEKASKVLKSGDPEIVKARSHLERWRHRLWHEVGHRPSPARG